MKRESAAGFGTLLKKRLGKAERIAILGIGDELIPTDRPGMVAARYLKDLTIPNVAVFLSETVPESFTRPLREFHPDHILLLDSADSGAVPGTFHLIRPGQITVGLMSTHVLPLTVLMKYVSEDTGAPVTLIGIQPESPTGYADAYIGTFQRDLKILHEVLRDAAGKNR